jgi:uncharacterized protein YjeT (DUF2065 family)
MLEYWLAAFALMLVLEGMTPFLFPAAWREALGKLAQLTNGQVRFVGLVLMLCGLILIYWVK